MRFGPFLVENISSEDDATTLTSTLRRLPDRICDVKIEPLGEGYIFQRVPYFSCLEALLVTLVSLASRQDLQWAPLRFPEHPTRLEVVLSADSVMVRLLGQDAPFYEGSFVAFFCNVARAVRGESERMESRRAEGLEVLLKFSSRQGW